MTFKHKLSHRLALLRSTAAIAATLLVSGGCNEGELGSLAPYDNVELAGEKVASISPKAVVLEADKPVKFKSSSENPQAVKWMATGGKITPEGTFSSPSEGEFLVVSSVSLSGGERTDTARVRVVKGQDGRDLTVSPRAVELAAGQSAHFTASATLEDGTPTTLKINWKAEGGTIDRDGNFVAGAVPGTYQLVAFSPGSGIADTVSVMVKASARQIVRLLLAPATAAVAVGGSVRYTASAQYEDGSTEPVWASFSVSGGGTISASGQQADFTAGTDAGTHQVTARTQDGSLEAGASVTVMPTAELQDPVTSIPEAGSEPAPAPVSLTGSNEPAGYTRFGELRMGTTLFSPTACSTSTATGSTGCWGRWGQNWAVKSDMTGPAGANVMQFTFPAGLPPGQGGDTGLWGWKQLTTGASSQYREVYESGVIKIPSRDFEMQLTGVKLLGYWGVGDPTLSKPVQLFAGMDGNGVNTAPMSAWHLSMYEQNVHTWRRDQNRNLTKWFQAGQWHRYEILMKLNEIGRANGVLKIWLDGTLTHEYYDVEYRTSAYPSGFFGRNWAPMWGGSGGTAKTRNDYLWINHLYMSGVPM